MSVISPHYRLPARCSGRRAGGKKSRCRLPDPTFVVRRRGGMVKRAVTETPRLGGVSLDTDGPGKLAEFYRQLLGLDVYIETDDVVALKGAGILLTAMRV